LNKPETTPPTYFHHLRYGTVSTLSLHHTDFGSFAMPREWTDWARPGSQGCSIGQPLLVDAFGLVALAELVATLASGNFEVDR